MSFGLYYAIDSQEISILPALLFGWEETEDGGEEFYFELGWLNLYLGVSFG